MGKNILWDLDGVIAQLVPGIQKYAADTWYKEVPLDWIGNDLTRGELDFLLNDQDFFSSLLPYDDTVKTMHTLHDRGYDSYIVTNRKVPMASTLRWLLDNNIPFKKVCAEPTKNRGKLAQHLRAEAMVEDNFNTALSISQVVAYSFCVQRPWNMFTHEKIITINSTIEILGYLT